MDERVRNQTLGLTLVVADNEARRIRGIQDGGAAVGVRGRRVEFLTKTVSERQAAIETEFVREVGAEVVDTVVATRTPGLREGEKWPAQ